MDTGKLQPNRHPTKMRNWLITGATGFIGREFVHHLLSNTEDHLTLLVRSAPSANGVAQRVLDQQAIIDASLEIDPRRLSVVECDFTKPRLGLADTEFQELHRYHNQFLHLAANTRFSETLEVARSVNVEGTERALAIALELHAQGNLERFAYVSTAYVHGCQSGVVRTDDPLQPERARNTYERSKSEAELLVRSVSEELPVVIFRPSIVLGDSVTGRASGSTTMYWAIKQYLRGRRRFFGNSEARLDIVPVDYVVSAMYRLMLNPAAIGQCFPLVAGAAGDITLGHLSACVTRYFGLSSPVIMNPRLIAFSSGLISRVSACFGQQVFVDNMLSYLPYFSSNPRFDNSATLLALASEPNRSQSVQPDFDSSCDVLFSHCLTMGWDKNRQRGNHESRLGLRKITG